MPAPKRILILGSTGSIGRRALDVINDFPDLFKVAGLAAHRNAAVVLQQARHFGVKQVCLTDAAAAQKFLPEFQAAGIDVLSGQDALTESVSRFDADVVLVATVGFTGLCPTIRAIKEGRMVALANKEVLVAAGDLIMALTRENGISILPIDSEHSAIFQCLQAAHSKSEIYELILTASGGPFLGRSPESMGFVTVEEALAHPTWNMGRKITIDSSTMMNKGFEVIEAMHLFGVPASQIKVLIHPQSVVHSMISFVDGSTIAQLGRTDMYLPIQYALTFPERHANPLPKLDLASMDALTFYAPDLTLFPCLQLAYDAIERGGVATTALNAANEVAVARFLKGEIKYVQIADIVRRALDRTPDLKADSLENILEADNKIRSWAVTY